MEKYVLVYQTVANPVAEISFFKMREGNLPATFEENTTYFHDDMDQDLIDYLEPFLEKIGMSNFESGESFTVHRIRDDMFSEIE